MFCESVTHVSHSNTCAKLELAIRTKGLLWRRRCIVVLFLPELAGPSITHKKLEEDYQQTTVYGILSYKAISIYGIVWSLIAKFTTYVFEERKSKQICRLTFEANFFSELSRPNRVPFLVVESQNQTFWVEVTNPWEYLTLGFCALLRGYSCMKRERERARSTYMGWPIKN